MTQTHDRSGPADGQVAILVVDDDAEVRWATVRMLEEAGFQVLSGGTAAEALELTQRHRPALVLLDVALPDGNGVDVARELKRDPALAGVFVVLVSGSRITPREQADGLNQGLADGYILRPFGKVDFLARVDAFLRIRASQEALRQSEKRFKAIADYTAGWESWFGPDGKYLWVNPSVERLTGYSPEEVLAIPDFISTLVAEEDRDMVRERLQEALKSGGRGENLEFRYLHKNGSKSWLSVSWQPILDSEGHFLGVRTSGRDIADRKRAEQALARSRAELKAIYDHAPVMLCVLDADRRVVYANPALTALTGASEGDLKSRRAGGALGCIHALDDPRGCGFGANCPDCALRLALEDTLKTGTAHYNMEHQTTLVRDGERREVVLLGSTALIQVDDRLQVLLCLNDITERKRDEEALRVVAESGARSGEDIFHFLVRQLAESQGKRHAAVARIDEGDPSTAHTVAVWSDGAFAANLSYEIEGAPAGNVVAQGTCFYPRDVLKLFPRCPALAALGAESYWGTPLRDAAGNLLGLLALIDDRPMEASSQTLALLNSFAARAAAELSRQRTEEKYRTLFNEMPGGFALHEIVCDPAGKPVDYRFLAVNPAFERMTGLRAAAIAGKRVSEVMPNLEPGWIETYGPVALSGKPERLENYITELGKWFEINLFRPEKGRFAAILRDITERKRAEEALRESQERFKAIADYTVDWESWFGPDGKYLWVNPTVERFTGYSAEEVLAMPDFIPILIAEEDRDMFRAQFREALNGSRGENLEFRYLHKNGSKSWMSASWQPILDEEGHSLGVRASFHDIADRKRAEESLRTSEERLRLTLDAAGIVAWEEGPAGGTIRETGPVGRLFGRAGGFRHPTLGDLAASIHPGDRERFAAAGDEARRRGSDFEVDFRVPLDGGEEKWIVARGTWLRDAEGKPRRLLGVAFDITERKRAEEALRKSDERLRSTLEAVVVVAWEADLVHGTLHETGPVDKLFGSAEGFLHRNVSDLAASIHAEDRDRVVAALDAARRGERGFNAEFRVPLDGGGEKWIRSRGTLLRDAAGRPVRLLGVAFDITERKRAEEALRASEQRYRGLFGSLLDGFAYCKMLYDDQGQPVDFIFLVINDAFEQLTGLRNMVGKPVSEMMPGIFESNPELLARHDRVASTGKSEKFEAYFIPLAVWLKVSVYSWEKGYFAVVFDNITERKQHEADREATLALLRLLNAPNDTHELIRTVVGLLREWSGCEAVGIRLREGDDYPYYETHGFPPEFVQAENHLCTRDAAGEALRDSQGNPVLECMCGNVLCGRTNPRLPFFTPQGSFWTNSTTALLASTTEADRQGRTRNRCNGEGYESVASIPLRYSGRTLGLVQLNDPRSGCFTLEKIAFLERAAGSIAIALEQRSTQAALRASEARYRLISENTSDVIWLLDEDSERLTYVSPSVRQLRGYSPEEVMAQPLESTMTPESYRDVIRDHEERLARLAAGDEHARRETHIVDQTRRDGSVVRTEVVTTLLPDEQGRIREVLGVTRDITERLKVEARLMQAQKMESVGRLAGGVAHDFNNLLTVINGYSRLALNSLDADAPLRGSLEEILKAGERAAGLTQQLLAFSRKQVLQPRLLDLNRVVDGMRSMLERLVGEDVELRVELQPDTGFIRSDPNQLEQVLMNLVVNSRDAMPHGGTLTIETSSVEIDDTYVASHPEARVGRYAVLAVVDSGVGMDEEALRHVFEPFFTTKEIGKGTGLGLSMIHGMVEQSGGFIEIASEPGRGATFRIYLPGVEGAADAAIPETGPAPGGRETVLVVEDQEEVGRYVTAALKTFGYEVMRVESAAEALAVCQRESERIDLVLTDVVMPNFSGPELAGWLKELGPAIKVLFMSGYTDDAIVHRGFLEAGVEFIQKPFSPDQLAVKVREVLGAPKSTARILVADDEAAIRGYLRATLEGAGYEVTEAADGKQALKEARQGGVDLVITDLVMPEQEGIETIQALRKEMPGIGIIAISGAFGGQFLEAARMLGADASLGKPVSAELLLAKVAEVLKLRR